MGCSASAPLPPLVSQEPSAIGNPLIPEAVGKDGTGNELVYSSKKLDGMLGMSTHFYKSPDGTDVLRYKRTRIRDSMITVWREDKIVAFVKHMTDFKGIRSGNVRAVLYGTQPRDGASGHTTVLEEGVTLHPLFEVRVEAGTGQYAYLQGLGLHAAISDGGFAGAPLLTFKSKDKVAMNDKAECVATLYQNNGVLDKKPTSLSVAAGVDATLIALLYAISEDCFQCSDASA